MAKTISKKISAKASVANPFGKTMPGDKIFILETEICFYAIEDGDETEEGEDAEILVVYDSILAVSKQNPVKRKFPNIDTFDHEGPVFISAMHDLTVGVFDHLKITSPMDVEKRLAYTQCILRGAELKTY